MRRVVTAAAVGLILFSCTGTKDNIYVQRDRIHDMAIKESPEKAHALFQEFADKCHARGDYEMESCALYEMATNYLDQRDTLGMRRILDRMKRLEVTSEIFVPNPEIDLDEYFRDCFGVWHDYETYPVRDITISCTETVAHYLRTLPLHHSQR